MEYIVNVETNEVIIREMSEDEIAQWQLDQETEAKRIAEEQIKADAKAAIAKRLGLTGDDLATLLG
jgi:hypothetical protein